MPVAAANMKFYLSGGAANSNVNASIGGAISSTEIVSNTLANLFDNVSGAEAGAGDTEYRCFYIKNTHATDSVDVTALWIASQTPSASTAVAIALDAAGIGGTAATPANENTAPAGATFTSPATEGAGLDVGTLAAGQFIGVWVRRTVTAAAPAATNDPVTISLAAVSL